MHRQPEPAPPRLAREGFVPAGPEKRVNKRAMLIPKTGITNATIPTLMDFSEDRRPPPMHRRAARRYWLAGVGRKAKHPARGEGRNFFRPSGN